jgi:hypothetical protein
LGFGRVREDDGGFVSEQLVSILKQLDATCEVVGIFNIHSNAGAISNSVFTECSICDLRTQIITNGEDWECKECGTDRLGQSWFAVNQPTTAALLNIRSSKSNEIIGALVITDSDEAQKIISHEIIVREEMQKAEREQKIYGSSLPNLSFLTNYVGAGLYANTLTVNDERIFIADKIAHLNSDFAILSMKVPNGNYLGINFCDQINDIAINADGEESNSEIRPYAFLLLHYDHIDGLSSVEMYEKETVDKFYSYFQASRDFDEMTQYWNYLYRDTDSDEGKEMQAPKILFNIECYKLNFMLQHLAENHGEAVSWLVMGMRDDDYLNKWLVDYLPVPSYVLESVMPYRGYQKPTPFNVFLFPSVDEVLDTHKTYEEFTAQSQALLDWVGKNHDKWHIELSESEGKAVRVFTQNSRNDSWEKLWAGWAPLQENFKLNVSTEAWKEMKQKSS